MTIGGIQISGEALGAILFAIGGLLTAAGLWVRANAKTVEAKAQVIQAQAQVTLRTAEAELAERLSITDTLKQYSSLLNAQIVINQQLKERADQQEETYQKRLQEKETRDESNYRVLSLTQDRIGQEIQGVLKKRFDTIDTTLSQLPTKVQEQNQSLVTNVFSEIATTVFSELATQLADRFAEITMAQEWYPFPDSADPEWRDEYVKPLVNKVRLYRRPVLSDVSLTDVQISQQGESMEVIQGRKKGWLAVRLLRDDKTPAQYGWLPEHEVTTGVTAIKLATNEQKAVTLNPVTVSP